MKKGCAILFLLLTSLVYSQNATLLQNIDFRAEELKHALNKTGDTLILEGERNITKVAIFNDDFEKSLNVNSKKTKIPLTDFPNGRFITEVKVHDKLIIITLIRHKPLDNISKSVATKNTEVLNNGEKIISQNEAQGKLLTNTNLETSIHNEPQRTVRFYWIVNKIYKGHSSRKIMKIGDKQSVEKIIRQNEIDLKTKTGQHNELVIWEVYDTSKFLRYKRINPDYANAEDVDCFNTIPFYKSGS
ncbi:hypothetical protein [Winogradskyella sp.]|uniref:hypothetical protein n=1 Tax=Winogradskyella sp. TaxID=1883156 RepID=UPI002623E3ED|nr:hypothetical protein [Winogradskyella sp.]